jgi:hypothetical protein
MKGESIASLLGPSDLNPNAAVNVSKLMFSENGQLVSFTQRLFLNFAMSKSSNIIDYQVVVTSACKSFIFNEMLSAWLKISDASSSVQVNKIHLKLYTEN